MAKDFQEVRQEILEMYKLVQESNYYELLGVDPEADKAKVNARFRELARKWHTDRFSQYDLGADKEKVQEIFAAINSAHRTLTNDDRRAEYDMEIHDGPSINEILEAESHFRRGKSMLNSGSYKGAYEAFKTAVEMKEDELEYQAHLLYTEYLLIPKNEDGEARQRARVREIFDELDQINIELQEKDWLLTFLGTVSIGLGKTRQAEGLFQEALLANSNNTNAKRQLRLLRSRRRKKKKKGGFFARLFGKK